MKKPLPVKIKLGTVVDEVRRAHGLTRHSNGEDFFKPMEIEIFSIDFILQALRQVSARTVFLKPEITSTSIIYQINCWRFFELLMTSCHFAACNRITSIYDNKTERACPSTVHSQN